MDGPRVIVKTGRHRAQSITLIENTKAVIVKKLKYVYKDEDSSKNPASNSRIAIMCAQEDPTNCHRRLLISKTLLERGLCVYHIRGDGSLDIES